MRVLITRPKHDSANHYLYCWTGKLVELAKEKKLTLFDLKKEKSNKKNVQGYLKKDQATLVFFNGHGNESTVFGHDDKEIISTSDNLSLLRDKIVFVRACSAAKKLGKEAVQKGAKAFIGYKSEFRFWHRKDFMQRPLKDPLARPFMECSNQVEVSLLKGHGPKEAHEKSLDVYKKEIAKAFTSEGDTSVIPALLHNMKNQVCLE